MACTQPSDPILPESLIGKWKLQSTVANLDERTAPELNKSIDYSDQELYFQFLKNGTFATNTDLGLNKLILTSGKGIAGKFIYTKVDGRSDIVIEILDPQYNEKVQLFFQILNLDTESPILLMDKEGYLKSINYSAENMEVGLKENLLGFGNRIIKARFSLNFKKI
jgi:hypothetical protein